MLLPRIRRMIPFAMSLLLFLALAHADSEAGTFVRVNKGKQYQDTPLNDDALITGLRVNIEAPIHGDVAAFASYISLDTTITGALVAAGQRITLGGEVGGSALVFSNDLVIDGRVNGTVMALAENISVTEKATFERDLYALAQQAFISGRMRGDLTIGARYASIGGEIDGDVSIRAQSVEILDGTVIGGDLEIVGCLDPDIADGAEILGKVDVRPEEESEEESESWGGVGFTLYMYISFFVVGVLLVLVTRRHYALAASAVTGATGRSLAYGILGIGAGIGLFIFLLLTLVGALAAVIALGLVILFMSFLGQLYTAGAVGSLLLSSDTSSSPGQWIAALLIGLVIIALLSQIPFVGWIVYLVSGLAGLGGFISGFLKCRVDTGQPVVASAGESAAG